MAESALWVQVEPGIPARPGHSQPAPPANSFSLLELFVLGILKEREMCGVEVARSLSLHPEFGVSSSIGIVYPLLKTLVKEGMLRSRRVGGKPRVNYSLTEQGRVRMQAIAERWASLNEAVQSVMADIGHMDQHNSPVAANTPLQALPSN